MPIKSDSRLTGSSRISRHTAIFARKSMLLWILAIAGAGIGSALLIQWLTVLALS